MFDKRIVRGRTRAAAWMVASTTMLLGLVATPAWGQTFTSLASFSGTNGRNPYAAPTLSGNTLYGTTVFGGNLSFYNYLPQPPGTVYSIPVSGGSLTVLAEFNGVNGAYPFAGLTLSGSTLYGATEDGGNLSLNNGRGIGTVFSLPLTGGTPTLLASFDVNGGQYATAGRSPRANLTLIGSTLYGEAWGGGPYLVYPYSADGTIFRVPLIGGSPALSGPFNGSNGLHPVGGLTLSGATFYGATERGGDLSLNFGGGFGAVFRAPVSGGTPTLLAAFNGSNGDDPGGGLTLSGNTLFGTTQKGGANGAGTVFRLPTSGGTPAVLVSFSGTGGACPGQTPMGNLTLIGSNLYGATSAGGSSGNGSIFRVGIGGSNFQSLLSFTGTDGPYLGSGPSGGLTVATTPAVIALGSALSSTIISGGTGILGAAVTNSASISTTFYGTTYSGGSSGNGTVFSLTVPDANSVNYQTTLRLQSGSFTAVGPVTPATGSLATGASQSCTVAASSTNLGVNALRLTVYDPNSANVSQTTTVALTVLDHAAAAFADGSGTLNLDFGTLPQNSGVRSLQFQIQNLPAAFRAGLDLDSVMEYSNPDGVFSTDAALFADLPADAMSNPFDVFLDTSQVGQFSGEYLLNLSDVKNLSGHAGQQTLVLNLTAQVLVPEPASAALLLAGSLCLLACAWRRQR